MMFLDIDSINILTQHLIPSREDTIKSGEGLISLEESIRLRGLPMRDYCNNNEMQTLKKPYLLLSSTKNTPDFNKSLSSFKN